MRVGVLASHGGSILQAVIDATRSGALPADVAIVISNNSRANALKRARAHAIPSSHLSGRTHPDPAELDAAIDAALTDARVEWVLLAGYMKQLGPRVLERFRNRILNTHPSLLPKFSGPGFFGRHVHAAVLEAGETETGATVHLVENDYDSGPILAQVRVPVRQADTVETLEERVKTAERKLVVATLMELSSHKAASGY